MSRADTIKVNLSPQEFICPVSLDIPTQPVLASCCSATFDLESVKSLRSCPCCRSKEATFSATSSVTQYLLQCISSALSASGQDTSGSISIDFPVNFIGSLITSDDKSHVVQNTIDVVLAQHANLYERMPFNLDTFIQIVRQDKLSTVAGERFIAQLKNSAHHLNQADVIQTLASTAAGRLILRKNLNVKVLHDKKVLCFGNAVLSPESLRVQVKGASILDLLAREIVVSLDETRSNEARLRHTIEAQYQAFIDGLYERQLIEKESEKIFSAGLRTQFPRWLIQEEAQKTRLPLEAQAQQEFRALLSVARKQGLFRNTVTAEYQYPAHSAVNDLLQQVVYGQRARVRAMLDQMKRENPTLLKTVLTSVATTPIIDYSGKKIENMTLLQAAFAAGDVAIHPDLANPKKPNGDDNAGYQDHQGMCEIIQSYFGENEEDKAEIAGQYASVLKRSLRENYSSVQISPEFENNPHELHGIHRRAQEQNTFDFSKIIAAITRAGSDAGQVTAALNKVGASFTESDAARTKGDDQLNLTESLNRFREQFEKRALSKIAINLYDLLKAFQIYDTQFDNWTWDQRNLFVRQVIGFVQRYLSAADVRVFAYGLYSAVEGKEKVPDHFNFRYDPSYHLFPLSSDRSCSGLGFDYDGDTSAYYVPRGRDAVVWKTYIEQKHLPVRELMPQPRVQSQPRNEPRCVIQ